MPRDVPNVCIITYVHCTTFGGTALLKFGRTKNFQNSARFRTTFDFDREYLRNQLMYPKLETNLIDSYFS